MDNTKKMILVDPHVLEKLKQKDNTPEDSLSRLDGEMQKIMSSKMVDREKWMLYLQTLQRYLHFTEEDRRPIRVPIVMDNSVDVTDPVKTNEPNVEKVVTETPVIEKDVTPTKTNFPKIVYTPSILFKLVPKTYKKRGELLLEYILKNEDKITWNSENGAVIINNEVIPNSNIIDLFNDTLRPLKRSKPTGWQKFAETLRDLKVPNSCIGNPKTFEYINKLNLREHEKNNSEHFQDWYLTKDTPTSSKDTPTSSKSLASLPKKKFNWEKWTPY